MWAASSAMIMEPPCPMQKTLSAWVRMSAACRMQSGWMRLRVWEMASTSAPYSLWHISWMSSSGVTSPLRKGMPPAG